jgi:hypothetical protein
MRTATRVLPIVLLAAFAGGCACDDLNRQAASGTVTYKGQPVASGSVTFAPLPETGRTHVTAAIQDGTFAVAKGKGLAPGKYQVRFTANDRVALGPTEPGAGPTGDPPKQILPARHNDQSTHEVEIKAGGPNEFAFDLD